MPDAHPCEFLDRGVALAREGFEDCGFFLLRMAAFGSSGHSTGSALLLLRADLHTYIEWRRRWIEFLDARNTGSSAWSVTWLISQVFTTRNLQIALACGHGQCERFRRSRRRVERRHGESCPRPN